MRLFSLRGGCAAEPLAVVAAVGLLAGSLSRPAVAQTDGADLSAASLEDLTRMRVTVSSFARRSEDLWTTPAAVYVISQDEIAHSAATSIPDLLRMVPGLQAAEIDASTWAVTARGFNNQFANKLLVLVDGRTIYSEIFSGVQWDEIDLPLENIERIEVIRGPGASVWGTNAANGVINILTKRARSTMGATATGDEGRNVQDVGVRYGAPVGDRLTYRAFARAVHRAPFFAIPGDGLPVTPGQLAYDGEVSVRGGARLDWQKDAGNAFTLSGDAYKGHTRHQQVSDSTLALGPSGQDNGWLDGGFLMGRWEHGGSGGAGSALQVYYQDQAREELGASVSTRTLDADYQAHVTAGSRHDLVYGSELRFTWNHIGGSIRPTTQPEYNNYLVDGFVQDEIKLVPNHLVATVGTKIQDGTLAGFQLQPSVRLMWAPDSRQTFWAGVSRAAVASSVQDKGLDFSVLLGDYEQLPVYLHLTGNPAYKPETVVAYEAGLRRDLHHGLTLDVASYLNDNRRLTSLAYTSTETVLTPSPAIISTVLYSNAFSARSAGVEGTLSWKPGSAFELTGSYTWDQVHEHQTWVGTAGILDAWSTPRNSASLSGWWNFAPKWSLNGFAGYVGALPESDASTAIPIALAGSVPDYTRVDVHVSRSFGRWGAVDAGGTNLLRPQHQEAADGANLTQSSYVPRSFYLRAKVNF